MRFVLVTLTSLSVSCNLFGPSCAARVDALRLQFDALAPTAGEVDAWARPDAPSGPVPNDRLAVVDLRYGPSTATRAVAIDAAAVRYVDGTAVGAGRAALCEALGPAPEEGLEPLRLHADGSARADAVLEFVADLHSCRAYRLDVVLARSDTAVIGHLTPRPPESPECPVDRTAVSAASPEEKPAKLAEALLASQEACRCARPDGDVLAAWQSEILPRTFVTSLPVRPSPSAIPFEVRAKAPWQDAAQTLVTLAGPDPFAHPVLLWVGNAGSLTPADEAALPPPP